MFNISYGAPVKGETKAQRDQEMTEKQQKEQAQPRILDVQEDASMLMRIWLWAMGEGQPSSESQSVPKTWDCPSTRPLKLAALPLGCSLPTNPVRLFSHLHRLWRKHTFYFHLNNRSPTALWMISCMWLMKKLHTSASLSHVSSLLYMLATCQITMTAPLVWEFLDERGTNALNSRNLQWSACSEGDPLLQSTSHKAVNHIHLLI